MQIFQNLYKIPILASSAIALLHYLYMLLDLYPDSMSHLCKINNLFLDFSCNKKIGIMIFVKTRGAEDNPEGRQTNSYKTSFQINFRYFLEFLLIGIEKYAFSLSIEVKKSISLQKLCHIYI